MAHRLQRLVVRLSRELRGESAETGVSSADARVLFDLRRYPGAGVSELARRAGVARSVISERLKRLEADGLVVRDAAPRADRRRVAFMVTPGGHRVLKLMALARRNQIAARLSTLTPAEREAIEQAVDALDRLPQWRSVEERAAEAERQREQGHERRQARQT